MIEKLEAKAGFNCVCCCERVRTCEKYWQVTLNGRNVRGERYCIHCEEYAIGNNPEAVDEHVFAEDDGERFLRQQETYAAYQAAGCTNAYWTDRDAGYCE